LLIIFLIGIILYYGKFILVPVTFAILIAMLLTPIANFLEKKSLSPIYSTLICLLIILLAFCFISFVIITEVLTLAENFPQIQIKFKLLLEDLTQKIDQIFNIPPEKQYLFYGQQARSLIQITGKLITDFLARVTSTLGNALLTLILSILFLYHRKKYEEFIIAIIRSESPAQTRSVIRMVSSISQKYLTGRMISILLLTAFYTIGFSLLGIKNAFLLSFFAAFLSIVPYIGTFIGGLFPVVMTLITEPSWVPALWVSGIIILGQLIDDYYIEPDIVGGKVHINAASSLIIIIVGGFLWGLSGLILFIPLLAILKVIFDHIDPLKPYGKLIGKSNKRSKN
jgi:predicted PurR-regulated permease PerM